MKSTKKSNIYSKNPIYIFYALGALVLFFVSVLFATSNRVRTLERLTYDIVNLIPSFLSPMFIIFMYFGSLIFALLLTFYFLIIKRRDVSLRVFTGTVIAFLLSVMAQNLIKSSRANLPTDNMFSRLEITNYSFPSSFVAVVTAIALTLALYSSKTSRKWLISAILLVAIAGSMLELYMPLDSLGGYAVGLFSFSLVSLVFGSVYIPVDLKMLTSKLREGGLTGLVLKPAKVDARGSVPFFGKYEKGPVFVKVFNQTNNAADWLFKLSRRVMYQRLEDEVPSITPKRTIEHEAFITILAKHSAGVRAPELLGVYRIKHNTYALATDLIDSDGLNNIEVKKVTDKMLNAVWKQIKLLHDGRIIHKDLRTANVMIEKTTNLPWIIDFGFSEQAVDQVSFYKDNVEFIASSASKVGSKRAVASAKQIMGHNAIKEALPFMQYSALSGATTTYLKQNNGLIEEIRKEMAKSINIDNKDLKIAKIKRISRKI